MTLQRLKELLLLADPGWQGGWVNRRPPDGGRTPAPSGASDRSQSEEQHHGEQGEEREHGARRGKRREHEQQEQPEPHQPRERSPNQSTPPRRVYRVHNRAFPREPSRQQRRPKRGLPPSPVAGASGPAIPAIHSCNRSPPSPKGSPARGSGPVMKPSSDIERLKYSFPITSFLSAYRSVMVAFDGMTRPLGEASTKGYIGRVEIPSAPHTLETWRTQTVPPLSAPLGEETCIPNALPAQPGTTRHV